MDIVVTTAGRAALVNAPNTGTAAVTITQVGYSATAIVPVATMTALPGEFKKIAGVAGEVVADDIIHVNVTDASTDAYELRSFALYLADGTLFAIYGQATPILEKTAGSTSALSIDAIFADISAAQITFGNTNFTNPPATTERQGVVELATTAETQAGTDPLRAVTPAALKAALLALILALDGSGSGIDADLLDGQHGSYYTNIVARLGYTPWGPSNDGAGSGLDADLFDGLDSSYFVNIPARLGYTPANRGGDTFTGAIQRDPAFYIDFTQGNPLLNFDYYDYLTYDRVNDAFSVVAGGQRRLMLRGTGDLDLNGTANLNFNGSKVWTAANDGAGSGLDADLFDGSDSSAFAKLANANTFAGDLGVTKAAGNANLYLTRSGVGTVGLSMQEDGNFVYYRDGAAIFGHLSKTAPFAFNLPVTISGNVTWHAGNDGSGSGLDADLLDGQHGSYYADIVSRLGYTPVSKSGDSIGNLISFVSADSASIAARPNTSTPLEVKGNGTGAAVMTFHRPNSHATFFGLDIDNQLKIGGWSAGAIANLIWHAGNDGSGSGLDADLFDGLQATDFLRALAFTNAQNGSMRLSNGLLLVWGRWTSSVSAGAATGVSFFTSFSAEPYTLMLLPVVTTASTVSVWSSDGITGSAFPGRCSQASIGCRYFAIGPV